MDSKKNQQDSVLFLFEDMPKVMLEEIMVKRVVHS